LPGRREGGDPAQEQAERDQLIVRAISRWLCHELREEDDRPDTGDRSGTPGRVEGEEGSNWRSQLVIGSSGIDQHIGIERILGCDRNPLTPSVRDVTYNQMVVETLEREGPTNRLFFALSDATRRDIVTQTLDRERSVSELGRLYPISLTAVQKHVEVLVDAGLVSKHRSGREQLVRGEVNQLRRAHTLLDELETVWRGRLERFEDVLNETTGKESE
jgi:DNA-binding transcriptional ArsR family regulator